MKAASRFKFYLVRYFLLGLAVLEGSVAFIWMVQFESTPRNQVVAFVFILLSTIFFLLHSLVSGKLKRVAISKKKITILFPAKSKSYHWDQVKEVNYHSVFNMYSLKLKGKNNRIYFLPNDRHEALFGLLAAKTDFTPKKFSKV
jgi:hypothetical protein